MKTALEYYRSRERGRLFVCHEHGFSKFTTGGPVLLVVFAPQGTSEIGFYRESTGKAMTAEIAADAWYRGTEGFRPAARQAGDDFTWPRWATSGSFLFHRPAPGLLAEFEEVPEYLRRLKQHQLRERYEKPSASPEPPPILRLVDAVPPEWGAAEWTELLGYVADRCALTSYWPAYCDGIGEHFYLCPCTAADANDWLVSLAKKFDCDFVLTTEDRIPRH